MKGWSVFLAGWIAAAEVVRVLLLERVWLLRWLANFLRYFFGGFGFCVDLNLLRKA